MNIYSSNVRNAKDVSSAPITDRFVIDHGVTPNLALVVGCVDNGPRRGVQGRSRGARADRLFPSTRH